MDEPHGRFGNMTKVATAQPAMAESSADTEPCEVEYSPISGWLLAAIGIVICGWLASRYSENSHQELPQSSPVVQLAVDINRATVEELQILPHIGPALAARIVQYARQHGPVTSLEQLDEIPGIGLRIIESLAPYLIFTAPTPVAEVLAVEDQPESLVAQQEKIAACP